MFQHAACFGKLALEIYHNKIEKNPPEIRYGSPFVVIAVFGIEVYIKALLLLTTGKKAKGHSLKNLYKKLNNEVKEVTVKIADKIYPKYRLDNNLKIEGLLEEINNAFVKWRYAYEKPPGVANFVTICFIIEVLHEAFRLLRK